MQRTVFSELGGNNNGVQIMSWRYSDNKGTIQWRILTWTIIQHTATSVRGLDRTGPSSPEINFSTCDGKNGYCSSVPDNTRISLFEKSLLLFIFRFALATYS